MSGSRPSHKRFTKVRQDYRPWWVIAKSLISKEKRKKFAIVRFFSFLFSRDGALYLSRRERLTKTERRR